MSWRQGRLLIVRVRRSAAYWACLFGRLRRFWRGMGSGVDPQLEAIALEGGEQPPPVRASKSWARARRQEPAWASSEAAAWSGAAVSESLTQSLHSSTLCRGATRATITDDQRQLVLQRASLRTDPLCADALRADALCASALRTKQPQLEQTKP